jgi:protoporphyrinogen oxidase
LSTKKVRVNTLGESRQYGFDKLISFMPLRELLFILHQQIQFNRDLIEKIEYLGLIYGVVELDTHAKSNFFALTIPDSDIVFHRLTYLNDLNNLNAIDSNKYFLFEITYKNEAQKLEILQNLDEKLIYGLIKTNITKSKELKSLEVKSVDKAYVVYNHFHKRVVNLANEVLTKNDIFLGGRIGGHKYYNMDQVIMNCYEILGKFEDF